MGSLEGRSRMHRTWHRVSGRSLWEMCVCVYGTSRPPRPGFAAVYPHVYVHVTRDI